MSSRAPSRIARRIAAAYHATASTSIGARCSDIANRLQRALLAVAVLSGCVAFTDAERVRWRAELEPRLIEEATGSGREWVIRNARNGQVNGWRWPASEGAGRAYLYARDPELCTEGSEQMFLVWFEQGDTGLFVINLHAEGVAVDLEPGWWQFHDAHSELWLEFEKREGENLLLLIEPAVGETFASFERDRNVLRAAEERWRYAERSREMVSKRCRKRRVIGTPVSDVPIF